MKASTREIVWDGVNMVKGGKRVTGRSLDVREWNEFPKAER